MNYENNLCQAVKDFHTPQALWGHEISACHIGGRNLSDEGLFRKLFSCSSNLISFPNIILTSFISFLNKTLCSKKIETNSQINTVKKKNTIKVMSMRHVSWESLCKLKRYRQKIEDQKGIWTSETKKSKELVKTVWPAEIGLNWRIPDKVRTTFHYQLPRWEVESPPRAPVWYWGNHYIILGFGEQFDNNY